MISRVGATLTSMHTRDAWRWPFYLAGGIAIVMMVAGLVGAVLAIVGGDPLGALTPIPLLILGLFLYEGAYALMVRLEQLPNDQTSQAQSST
jgi:hypothetical protein